MQPISTIIQATAYAAPSTLKGPNSARGEQVEALLALLGEKPTDRKRYAYWCGRTRHLSPQQIHFLIVKAKEGRNPAALFNHLLKQP